jgi:hypothetical protein
MAKVTMTITDFADNSIGVTIEADPPMPLTGGELDSTDDRCTPAMAAAVLAANVLGRIGEGDFSMFAAESAREAETIMKVTRMRGGQG